MSPASSTPGTASTAVTTSSKKAFISPIASNDRLVLSVHATA